jgi:acetyl-CoA acetyltransferase
VVGADTTPKGFLAPNKGERVLDPDWLRFRLLGATNPTYFGLYARRRMDLFGATERDFARVKVKNSRHGLANPNARFKKLYTEEEVLASPLVSAPLRLLDICATSDGGAAIVLSSLEYARRRATRVPRIAAVSTITPTYPDTWIDMPKFATDSAAGLAAPDRGFKDSIAFAAYEEAGLGPEDLSLAEVYDLSSALELDWYENIGLCKPGEAERLLRTATPRSAAGSRSTLGRPRLLRRGGACAGARAGVRARVAAARPGRRTPGREREGGITANQGLFGHGSSVIAVI